jgi:cytochrome c peroxidase
MIRFTFASCSPLTTDQNDDDRMILFAFASLLISFLCGCDFSHTSATADGPEQFTNSIGMQLVRIPAGAFLMGSPQPHPLASDTQPQHRVRISRPFYMGAHEVTQEQYERILGPGLSHTQFCATGTARREVEGIDTLRFPVDGVSWGEALAFCETLSALPEEIAASRVYRLPTEAEWEYACRGGTETAFAFGDRLSLADANINAPPDPVTGARALQRTTTAGSYAPNAFGLYDMHGNVWEWCEHGKRVYTRRAQTDPVGPQAFYHVIRGGAWDFPAAFCQSDYRIDALREYVFVGFRVVCELKGDRRRAKGEWEGEASAEPQRHATRGAKARMKNEKRGTKNLGSYPLGLRAMFVPEGNPSTPAKMQLGKQLFFDTRLSRDDSTSCATCHQPSKGWSSGERFAKGVAGAVGRRHVPTLVNVGYLPHLFWDGRASNLEELVRAPLEDPLEMGMPMNELAAKLNNIPGYRAQFQSVFGGDATPDRIAAAIASFVRTIVSGGAPYDRFRRGDLAALSPAARRGHDVFFFRANCAACHAGPLLSDGDFHNTGVGMDQPQPDLGRFLVTRQEFPDRGAFKTPTLREIAHTAPYMHDGRFQTLEEVVDFYLRGGHLNSHLDPKMNNIPLADQEKADLLAFLKEALASDSFDEMSPPELPE